MKILAIIDLDTKRENGEAFNKMVANNLERAEIARQHADQFSQREQWLEMIEKCGAEIVYLTSRPHTLKSETETWLAENNISHPMIYKYYGTGELDPATGKTDTGDRYMKTSAWKKREVKRVLDKIQPDWLIFVDDEEANRAAVAEIGDPRLLIRCSLEDAATHDFARHEIEESTPPFLRRLQELANILEQREQFEKAEKWAKDISHPLIPGQQNEPGMIARVEAWSAAAYAPGAEPGARFYRYSELMPVETQNEDQIVVCALEMACDQAGHIASVRMAKPGPGMSLLELEDSFDMPQEKEKAQRWADEWKAHSIEEFGYVEAAKAIRGMQTIGKPALEAYLEHVRQKNEEIKAALQGRHKR